MEELRTHLEDAHNRLVCQICIKHRALVLSEQKLYTKANLGKHLKDGDFDEEGTLVFLHPFCDVKSNLLWE